MFTRSKDYRSKSMSKLCSQASGLEATPDWSFGTMPSSFTLSSNRQTKRQTKEGSRSTVRLLPILPDQVSIYLNVNRFLSCNVWTTSSHASPTFSPALNPGRLPNGPPQPPQQSKDLGSFPPLDQQDCARRPIASCCDRTPYCRRLYLPLRSPCSP